MVLELIAEDRRDGAGTVEPGRWEVADADVAHGALPLEVGQVLQRFLQRHRVRRPMQQHQVDVVGAELLEALERALLGHAAREVRRAHLRHKEELRAGHAGVSDAGADFGLVVVPLGRVDVAVPDAQGVGDPLAASVALQAEGAEPERGHACPLDLVMDHAPGYRRRGRAPAPTTASRRAATTPRTGVPVASRRWAARRAAERSVARGSATSTTASASVAIVREDADASTAGPVPTRTRGVEPCSASTSAVATRRAASSPATPTTRSLPPLAIPWRTRVVRYGSADAA